MSWSSRTGRGGISAHSFIVLPWAGYGVPSRTPLNITAAAPLPRLTDAASLATACDERISRRSVPVAPPAPMRHLGDVAPAPAQRRRAPVRRPVPDGDRADRGVLRRYPERLPVPVGVV